MDQHNLHHISKNQVCELCNKHDPLVKDYSEDFDLQTALRSYMEKTTGERLSIADIARLCDSCYTMVSLPEEEEERE